MNWHLSVSVGAQGRLVGYSWKGVTGCWLLPMHCLAQCFSPLGIRESFWWITGYSLLGGCVEWPRPSAPRLWTGTCNPTINVVTLHDRSHNSDLPNMALLPPLLQSAMTNPTAATTITGLAAQLQPTVTSPTATMTAETSPATLSTAICGAQAHCCHCNMPHLVLLLPLPNAPGHKDLPL